MTLALAVPAHALAVVEGKCLGTMNNYCKTLLLPDGSIVPNPDFKPIDPNVYTGDLYDSHGLKTTVDNNDNDNNDRYEDADREECQEEDDYCDISEGCHETYIDCIDDRGFDEDDYNG